MNKNADIRFDKASSLPRKRGAKEVTENLNIDDNIKQMIVGRCNKKRTLALAAESLGISTRTLERYRWRFNIQRCPVTKEFFIEKK